MCGADNTLKAYPKSNPRRFSLNILRFIADKDLNNETEIKTKNIVETINRKDNLKPFLTFKFNRLSLVESDPFLFNNGPEINHYSLG